MFEYDVVILKSWKNKIDELSKATTIQEFLRGNNKKPTQIQK